MKKTRRYFLVSLGCAKNTVDSDSMGSLLEEDGFTATTRPDRADVLIVNTCGFIEQAREESYSVLQELADHKHPGQLLIAAGCLTQRFGQDVVRRVPAVDGILGTRRWMDILDVVQQLRASHHPAPVYHIPEVESVGRDERGVLRASVQGTSAYLKIADGCRRLCAFCAIPLIKGPPVSRPLETIIEEAKILQDTGVREIILIAQDTTDYGHDLGMKDGLAVLLETLVREAPQIDWIRVMYAYPGYVTDHLIEVMAQHKQILPYLDIPLQHAHHDTLLRMRRPSNMNWVRSTIKKMRAVVPNLALRTTFIVGYPGETEEEFQTLLDFMEEIRFDRVGAFTYSCEAGTRSEALGDSVPQVVKDERLDRLMTLQQRITLEKNQGYIGKTLDVLIEGANDGISVGRSYRDAPEIDGLVFIEGLAPVGEIFPVRITGALTHDLTGVFTQQPG